MNTVYLKRQLMRNNAAYILSPIGVKFCTIVDPGQVFSPLGTRYPQGIPKIQNFGLANTAIWKTVNRARSVTCQLRYY